MSEMDRRTFLLASTAVAAAPLGACIARPLPVRAPTVSLIPEHETGTLVNDVHSQLNATRVASIVKPRAVDELQEAIAAARAAGKSVSVAGGRHAMGGQQFGEGTVLVDTRDVSRVLAFDADSGTITAEGGIQWPQLLEHLNQRNDDAGAGDRQWGIYQKQTGADRLSLAGALSCNAHGRGLNLKPIVDQVMASDLVDATGERRTCSRTTNADLFRLAIGGYGLFGIITRVQLKLRPRVKVRRVVALGETAGIMERFDERIRDGYLYGDYQFTTDSSRDSFLRRGVFSCYQPVPPETPLTPNPTRFHPDDWARLTFYSHKYKRRAFEVYSSRYLKTSGQVYDETFLAWARERYACVIFNLHVEHTPQAIDRAADAFRDLIDLGIQHGGSYYLTYHRWARKEQLERCYPQMQAFLQMKRRHDSAELFQSNWYRHHRAMFG